MVLESEAKTFMDPAIKSKVSLNLLWKCGGTAVPGGMCSMNVVFAPLVVVVEYSSWKRRAFQRRSVDMVRWLFDG